MVVCASCDMTHSEPHVSFTLGTGYNVCHVYEALSPTPYEMCRGDPKQTLPNHFHAEFLCCLYS